MPFNLESFIVIVVGITPFLVSVLWFKRNRWGWILLFIFLALGFTVILTNIHTNWWLNEVGVPEVGSNVDNIKQAALVLAISVNLSLTRIITAFGITRRSYYRMLLGVGIVCLGYLLIYFSVPVPD